MEDVIGEAVELSRSELARQDITLDIAVAANLPMVLGDRVQLQQVIEGVVDSARLADYPWVVSAPGTPLQGQWQAMFDGAGIAPPRVGIACGSVMMARQMLVESDFLTLLDRHHHSRRLAPDPTAGAIS